MKIQKNYIIIGILIIALLGLLYVAVFPKETEYNITMDYYVKTNDGTVVDTSLENIAKEAGIYSTAKTYKPLTFTTGTGQVIEAVDIVAKEMKKGEERTIIAPPEKAYGNYDASLFQEEVEKLISVDENTTIKKADYIQMFQSEPVKGQVIQIPNFAWELEVTEVTEEMVTFENKVKIGDEVTLSGTSWKSRIEKIENGKIFMKQNPKQYDQMIINLNGQPKLFRVVRVKGQTFDIDGNHPLAGETLTFQIYMREKTAAK